MTIGTLARYLVGDRRAIEEIAQSRWSLLVGLLLVLTAGLARNYDGAYLAAEWDVLLHGPVVSVVNALVLFTLVYLAACAKRGGVPPFVPGFLSFLGLFWMTAPMAWAYAVPYERFVRPGAAVEANLWTLAVVSAWRVALMTRVLSVLYNCRAAPVFLLVVVFADAVLLGVIHLTPMPVLDFMGGLQHIEQDAVLVNTAFSVGVLATLSAPVWLIAAVVGLKWFRPQWALPAPGPTAAPRPLLGFAAAALLAWAPLLMLAQPEQRLRWRAEALLRSGEVEAGLRDMSRHRREDYPPIWDPPPRMGYQEEVPSIKAVRAALSLDGCAPWVEDEYLAKSWRALSAHWVWGGSGARDRERLVTVVEERGATLAHDRDMDEKWAGLRFHLAHDRRLSPEQRDRLRAAMDNAERERAEVEAAERANDTPPQSGSGSTQSR